jgi:ribose transport system permease protein
MVEARHARGLGVRTRFRGAIQLGLPAIALAVMLAIIFWKQPSAMSYFGFSLLFKLSIPLVIASGADVDHNDR